MIILIIILIMLVVLLSVALAVSLKGNSSTSDEDYQFRNQEGDHVYYDKSIIEKKKFHRLYPKYAARSISRFIRRQDNQNPKQ